MASVNYQKIKTAGEVKAKLRHDEKEERKNAEHTNPNIDKSMTDNNLSYRRKTLPDGSQVPLNYKDLCMEYNRVIKDLDAKKGANKRKDRVTCLSLEIPTPDGMTEDQEEDYFYNLGKVFEEEFPECYLLDGFFHRDEKHDYYDPEDKMYKESRNHATFRYIPIKNGKLNAKATLTRAKMKQVNQRLEEMCQSRYGLNFNNGKGKRGKSVEQLKAESNLAEMKKTDEVLENKRNDLQELNNKYNTLQENYNDLSDKYNTLKNDFENEENYEKEVEKAINNFIKNVNEKDAKREFITKKGLWKEFVDETQKNIPNPKAQTQKIKKRVRKDLDPTAYLKSKKAFKDKMKHPRINSWELEDSKNNDQFNL